MNYQSGFMAYASTSSPFAAVKGQNIFASKKAPATPVASTSTSNCASPSPLPPLSSPFVGTPNDTPAAKRSGFEAFASSASPFASVARVKSPVLGIGSSAKLGRNKSPTRPRSTASSNSVNAFSAYAGGGVQGFALPLQKRPRGESPDSASTVRSVLEKKKNGNVAGKDGQEEEDEEDSADERPRATTFGEKLRAGKDDEDEETLNEEKNKVTLTEQELTTGEEDEETIHQVRGKLYMLIDGAWKERGTGLLKLNVRASDGSGARLLMRKEAVYALLLNVPLFYGMKCELAQDPRYVRFSVIESGAATHYNLRLANAKIAKELMEEVLNNLPGPPSV